MVDIRLINIYASIFLAYLAVQLGLAIVPAQSAQPSEFVNIYVNSVFILVSFVVSFPFVYIREKKSSNKKKFYVESTKYLSAAIFLSLLGFLLLIYDRIILRGIDYSGGLRAARYLWLDSPGGNVAGVLGNLLSSFGYFSLVVLATNYKLLTKTLRVYALLSTFTCVIGLSLLNGGRSNILVAFFVAMTSVLISQKKSMMAIIFSEKKSILVVLMAIILPVVVVTHSSAALGDLNMKTHFELEVASLYGASSSYPSYGLLDDFVYSFYYMLIYLIHGQWTAQYSASLSFHDSFYTLYPLKDFIHQFGLLDTPEVAGYFSDVGALISLPGALYYDYGVAGHFLGSIIFGVFLGIALRIIRGKSFVGGFAGSYVMFVLITFLMSPMMLSYGFTILIFVFVPFIFFEIITMLIFPSKKFRLFR